jgi:hypothetical protein
MPVYQLYEVPGWRQRFQEEVDDFIDRKIARAVEEEMLRLCPVRTGRLKSTIRRKRNRIWVGGRNADYWWALEYGTKPHIIRPKEKKALWWPGAEHPVLLVRHPGTPARPFIRPALYVRISP